METIRQRSVLQAVLLQTLAEHPDGLSIDDAYDTIDQNYALPEEWYRQIPASGGYDELRDLGHDDWRTVPQDQLIELVSTEPQWQNEIRWARNDLPKAGHLDTTAPRGIWRLTEAGHLASVATPAGGWSADEQRIIKPRKPVTSPRSEKEAPKPTPVPGTGMRKDLLNKLELLTQSMPLNDLKVLVEIARVLRKRSISIES
jgi:Mrr N-terminal domain